MLILNGSSTICTLYLIPHVSRLMLILFAGLWDAPAVPDVGNLCTEYMYEWSVMRLQWQGWCKLKPTSCAGPHVFALLFFHRSPRMYSYLHAHIITHPKRAILFSTEKCVVRVASADKNIGFQSHQTLSSVCCFIQSMCVHAQSVLITNSYPNFCLGHPVTSLMLQQHRPQKWK